MTADTLIPAWCDTRETFRTKFAAAYVSHNEMTALIYRLADELEAAGARMPLPYHWEHATLPALRELALYSEHLLYAVEEWRQAAKAAGAQGYRAQREATA